MPRAFRRRFIHAAALGAVVMLAACASTGPRMSAGEKYALYESNAGAAVDHFRYTGSINGWTALGDEALAVWTRPGEAWLLDLAGPCQDLAFSNAIGLTSSMNQVNARFDKVLVRGRGPTSLPCHIQQIRPLDVKAIRAAERQDPADVPGLAQPLDQASDSGT